MPTASPGAAAASHSRFVLRKRGFGETALAANMSRGRVGKAGRA